jgi:hypothetical protein
MVATSKTQTRNPIPRFSDACANSRKLKWGGWRGVCGSFLWCFNAVGVPWMPWWVEGEDATAVDRGMAGRVVVDRLIALDNSVRTRGFPFSFRGERGDPLRGQGQSWLVLATQSSPVASIPTPNPPMIPLSRLRGVGSPLPFAPLLSTALANDFIPRTEPEAQIWVSEENPVYWVSSHDMDRSAAFSAHF